MTCESGLLIGLQTALSETFQRKHFLACLRDNL